MRTAGAGMRAALRSGTSTGPVYSSSNAACAQHERPAASNATPCPRVVNHPGGWARSATTTQTDAVRSITPGDAGCARGRRRATLDPPTPAQGATLASHSGHLVTFWTAEGRARLTARAGAAGRQGTYHSSASEHPIKRAVPGGPGLTLCRRVRRTGPDPMQARGEQTHSSTRPGAGRSAS